MRRLHAVSVEPMLHLPASLKSLLDLSDAERRLGPFVLVAPLGRGGFAPVWLARERYGATELRTAAVKLFSLEAPDGSAATLHRAGVIDEARALCRVEHPNVVRFYALPTDEVRGVIGLAMEHVAGTPLDRRIAEAGTLPVGETIAIGAAVASALAAVHRAGLVHRDVKPANVVEAGGVYKLIDFGIAAAERVQAPESDRRRGDRSSTTICPLEVTDTNRSFLDAVAAASAEPPATSLRAWRGGAGTLGYIDPECVSTAGAGHAGQRSLRPRSHALRVPEREAAVRRRRWRNRRRRAGRPQAGAALSGRRARRTARAGPHRRRAAGAGAARSPFVGSSRSPSSSSGIRLALSGLDRALPAEDVGPFRGLGRFEEGDRDVYFGRAGEVAAALDLLRGLGLAALVGSSGSGKSSLARAGVLPRVAEGALGGWPKRWDTAIVTPGNDARGAVASALAALDPPLQGAAEIAPEALVEALAKRAESTDRGIVLLVDQLEELATLGGGESSAWAVELLGSLGERVLPGVRALVTVRRESARPAARHGEARQGPGARIAPGGADELRGLGRRGRAGAVDLRLRAGGHRAPRRAARRALADRERDAARAVRADGALAQARPRGEEDHPREPRGHRGHRGGARAPRRRDARGARARAPGRHRGRAGRAARADHAAGDPRPPRGRRISSRGGARSAAR